MFRKLVFMMVTNFLSSTPSCSTVSPVPSTHMLSGFDPVRTEESVNHPNVSSVGMIQLRLVVKCLVLVLVQPLPELELIQLAEEVYLCYIYYSFRNKLGCSLVLLIAVRLNYTPDYYDELFWIFETLWLYIYGNYDSLYFS